MWLFLTALLLVADPGQDEAEALFNRMEQQVLNCQSLHVQMEVAVEGFPHRTVKGRLLLDKGNKMRLEIEVNEPGRPHKAITISDGSRMLTMGAVPRMNDETPATLNELFKSSITRFGVWMTMFAALERKDPANELKDFDLDRSLAVSGFTLGMKESLAGQEAQIIEYKLTLGSEFPTKRRADTVAPDMVMTVWIDVRTQLPLKRTVAIKDKEGAYQIRLTETYTLIATDGKLDAKEFQIPE